MTDSAEIKNTPSDAQLKKTKKRNFILICMLILLTGAAIWWCVTWWLVYRNYESTDDAYIGGNMVVLSSRQDGSVIAIHVDDTVYVKQGDVLVQLDSADYLENFNQKKDSLALAARHVVGLDEDVQQQKANVLLQEAKHERAALDASSRGALVDSEAIAVEDFQHATADLQIAKASLELARHQLKAAQAALGSTELAEHPMIENAKSELKVAYLRWQRCTIKAPVTGYIAKRNVQLGQTVGAGTSLMAIVPLDAIWVDANFKETQLEKIRIGQPVQLRADIYGSAVVFNAKVAGLIPGSGSVFSLLPPQNASGNWIKIVQRVPVRIYLDQEEMKKYPLVLGLTVYTTIDISDTTGLMLADKPIEQLTRTDVFEIDMHPVETIISEILKANLP